MRVSVLALQGAFIEHEQMLSSLGAESFEIRQRRDIEKSFDALILPGGESTVMGKLLHDLKLFEPLKEMISGGMPTFGTCAGLLLLAKNIENDSRRHFALMDITAVRNGYGRQLGSFHTREEFEGLGVLPMTFIRAPYISSVGENVKILSRADGKIVAAREKNMLVTSFHPELDEDLSVHKYFLNMVNDK
jgi:5'-phosphate synthase pdxT subunit